MPDSPAFCAPCALFRLLGYVALLVFAVPFQLLALLFNAPLHRKIPLWFHSACLRVMNIELRLSGAALIPGPGLIVCNHISYLDIPVLGAIIPGCFVAKSEVAGWPLFGFLARLQRTVFVRRQRSQAGKQRDQIGARLEEGALLILFPEGTSSDGAQVLAFKSALFAVADQEVNGAPLKVQPVSLACTKLNDLPMQPSERDFYAWYGDMDLAPHLWQFLGLGKVTVELVVHPPLTLQQAGSRKDLARVAQAAVVAGHAQSMQGGVMRDEGTIREAL